MLHFCRSLVVIHRLSTIMLLQIKFAPNPADMEMDSDFGYDRPWAAEFTSAAATRQSFIHSVFASIGNYKSNCHIIVSGRPSEK